VNADLPAILAAWAAEHSAALIQNSTEYVFDCQSDGSYLETDKMHPLDIDGESKLAGDRAILESGTAVLILRNAWLYGATGRNFLTAILRQAEEQDALCVAGDQFGVQTSTTVLAETTEEILQNLWRDVEAGLAARAELLNVTRTGAVSRFEFAEAICTETQRLGHTLAVRRITPISTDDLQAAPRPWNS
ncbi:MAG: sugar nucleotide-binding protein, partial [Pseudomonadota bacterium]|nr:sugar nucleotide-binding protein [Pseudomonadota bacterium]